MEPPKLTDSLGNELAYDLRQVYAVDILGEHLKDVARARKKDLYNSYFKCLKDVWIIVKHKIKKKDSEENNTKYTKLMTEAVKIANEFPSEFNGEVKNAIACAKIEHSLNEVEIFLYDIIEVAGVFGSNKKIPGL